MRIGIVAVEVSGDRLGADLMQEIKKSFPEAQFVGCGGDLMHAQGLKMLCHIHKVEAIGVIEVLLRLIPLLRLRAWITRQLLKHRIDIFIGVDGPDFNGAIENKLTRSGITCVHYVCPTIWVWRKNRASYFSRINRRILCLYPYEKKLIDQAGGTADYVGHPLADSTPMHQSRRSGRDHLGLTQWVNGRKVIAVLAGSRKSEITYLLPIFLATAAILVKQQSYAFLVSAVSEQKKQLITQIVNKHGSNLDIKIITGNTQRLIAASDFAMVASGTATLETLLVKRPMIVAYKVHWLSYKLIAWLMRRSKIEQRSLLTNEPITQPKGSFPLVSQPNLLGGKLLVPEFIQSQAQPPAMAKACQNIMEADNSQLTATFHHIHLALRNNAAATAAKAITPLILEVSADCAHQ